MALELDRETACALVEAGYLPLPTYLELVARSAGAPNGRTLASLAKTRIPPNPRAMHRANSPTAA
jgi:hypothetical protein